MEREILKQLIREQSQIKLKQDLIPRELLKKVEDFKKSTLIMIISGIRRSGKSTMAEELRAKYTDSYYVNFDDERFINFTVEDFQLLYELLIELFGQKDIFFFDEIQNIPSWERFVRRLHDAGKKLYITGSNASMLSRELGTHLTGRHIPLSLYPFSFREFLLFKGHSYLAKVFTTQEKSSMKRLFNEFLAKGGFPEYLQTGKEDYLKSVYENILYRDIVTRYKLPREKPIKEVVYYAMSNIGKEISFNSLKKLTGLTSATTIKEYFSYLENSYLLFLIAKYSSSLKKQIYTNKKVYAVDTGLAKVLGFRPTQDYGRMLENIVFIELKRKGHEIYFHKENHECDFLIRHNGKIKQAIQVTASLSSNKEREMGGLVEALKKYKLKKGLVLTEDEEGSEMISGKKIVIKPIWKWLLFGG